nr:7336_t:CDS:2 [Entrophospora candida]
MSLMRRPQEVTTIDQEIKEKQNLFQLNYKEITKEVSTVKEKETGKIQGISIEIEKVEVITTNFNNNNNNSNDTPNTNPTATSLHNTPVITNAASKTSLTSSASSSSSMIAGEGITVTSIYHQPTPQSSFKILKKINEAISNDLTVLALRVDWECEFAKALNTWNILINSIKDFIINRGRWKQPIGIRDDDGWFINANKPNQKDVLIELESINQHKCFAATLRNFRVYSSGLIEKKFIVRVEEFNKHIEQAWSNIGEKVIYPDHSDHDQNENHLVKKGVYAYHRKMEDLKFKVNKAMKDYQDALRLLEKELQQKSDDLFNDTFNQNKRPILMSMSELRI